MQRLIGTVLAGSLAGLTALVLDQGLARLTLGYAFPMSLLHVGTYLALGLAAALIALLPTLIRRKAEYLSFADLWAYAVVIVYGFPVFEWVQNWLYHRGFGLFIRIAAGLVGIAVYAGWACFMARVVARRNRWVGALAAALAPAVGLAINQNVFYFPFTVGALAADSMVVAVAVGIAALARAGNRTRLVAAGAAAVIVLGWVGLSFVGGAAPAPVNSGSNAQPNLVVIIIDTLRADVFEEVVAETEEGQAFHRALGDATWFTQAFAASPWTPPSVASVMTGLYPPEHGHEPRPAPGSPELVLMELSSAVLTIAEQLRDRGYWTEALITNSHITATGGLGRGYDRFEYIDDAAIHLPVLKGFSVKSMDLLPSDPYQNAGILRRQLSGRIADLQRLERPYYLWLHLMDPHEPLTAHRDLTPDPVDPPLSELRRMYRDETRYCLRELAAMIEEMERAGLLSNTILALVSDHGEMFPADGHFSGAYNDDGSKKLYGHGHAFFEEVSRIPFIVRLPDAAPGDHEVTDLVSHVDLYDTLAELMGIDLGPLPPGRFSLASLIATGGNTTGVGESPRSFAYLSANVNGPRQLALRTAGFKLITYPNGERGDEVYDLTVDPLEKDNIATLDPERLAELKATLEAAGLAMIVAESEGPAEMSPEMIERLEALGYLQ